MFKTKYKGQELTGKQFEVLDQLDNLMVDYSDMPLDDEVIDVKMFTVNIFQQVLPASTIVNGIKKSINFEAYIPRSIALTTVGSDWQIYIGIRRKKELTEQDMMVNFMFSDLVTRTNSARSKIASNSPVSA